MFRNCVKWVLGNYAKGEPITIRDVAEGCGICEETASKYLKEMTSYAFLDLMGPAWGQRQIYLRGCAPFEEEQLRAKIFESSVGAAAFALAERAAGFLRPFYFFSSPNLSWGEKQGLIDKWYKEEYWPEIHLILGVGLPLLPVVSAIIGNEVQQALGDVS